MRPEDAHDRKRQYRVVLGIGQAVFWVRTDDTLDLYADKRPEQSPLLADLRTGTGHPRLVERD
jgi:hypothetical protein